MKKMNVQTASSNKFRQVMRETALVVPPKPELASLSSDRPNLTNHDS